MQLLPLEKLGCHQQGASTLQFGMLLPWVNPGNDQQLSVKLIHEHDQFLQRVPPVTIPMMHTADSRYGDLWTATVDLSVIPNNVAGSNWGKPGRYVYRYALSRSNGPDIDWIIDPYAREYGTGKQSAITVDYTPYQWSPSEAMWRTPATKDLVMYELNLAEFARDIDGAIERLEYLADLGINCIQLMPVSNVAGEVDWGYLPIGYFGVDERFGQRKDLQHFIDCAHQRGMAVMVDAVYGHASRASFAYSYTYKQLGYEQNPFMGPFAQDLFSEQGASTDYNRTITQDFFFSVNQHWLDVFHVDGFRYDCVPNFWDGPMGNGYANLAYATHELAQTESMNTRGYWKRFEDAQACKIIQCAEYLNDPAGILQQSYSTSAWQNETLSASQAVAQDAPANLYRLGASLALFGCPSEVTVNGTTLPKTALQYIENHDHSRFVSNFGAVQTDEANNAVFLEGNRDLWYKVQPYLLAMMTAKGVPLLWQGQEIGENYTVPWNGSARVAMLRPVRWDHFYDQPGQSLISMVRNVLAVRRDRDEMRQGEYHFHNNHDLYQSRSVLIVERRLGEKVTVVAMNFGDEAQYVPFTFNVGGRYEEQLHGFTWDVTAGEPSMIEIPANYGRIWSTT